MRFIDKKVYKATKYQTWLKTLTKKNHPKYVSSSFRFYYAIAFDLLVSQKGLCAYTEKFLTKVEIFEKKIWDKGNCSPFKFAGQLDHYDPTLKGKRGWLWENFFIADTDVNTKNKGQLQPNGILKPDKIGFNASDYLDYDLNEHIFIPRMSLSENEKKEIRHDLFVLGMNFEPIVQLRKKYLNPYLSKIRYKQQTIEEIKNELFQFYTAFEMSSKNI